MKMKIGNTAIHAASLIAQKLDAEGRRDEAAAIFALVDSSINLEVRLRTAAAANA